MPLHWYAGANSCHCSILLHQRFPWKAITLFLLHIFEQTLEAFLTFYFKTKVDRVVLSRFSLKIQSEQNCINFIFYWRLRFPKWIYTSCQFYDRSKNAKMCHWKSYLYLSWFILGFRFINLVYSGTTALLIALSHKHFLAIIILSKPHQKPV